METDYICSTLSVYFIPRLRDYFQHYNSVMLVTIAQFGFFGDDGPEDAAAPAVHAGR